MKRIVIRTLSEEKLNSLICDLFDFAFELHWIAMEDGVLDYDDLYTHWYNYANTVYFQKYKAS